MDLTDQVEEITNVQEQPAEPQDQDVKTPDVDSWKYDTNYLKLMDHFKIEPINAHWYKDKLAVVMDWAQLKSQSKDIIDVLVEIKALQRELGMTSLEKSINEIYRWIRLDQDEQRIKKQKGLLTR